MHEPEAPDYAPLSFGAGLAIGLLLILALPAQRETKSPNPNRQQPAVGHPQ